ncbi:MFS transporter [Allonocardiopsis opalescens]|uniref:UMF1 family MFS transporter n=1 Tax=Allonocardiopsis opalescens TaxID=1144618 RepID=A0A2T0PTU8_9ACTN|nr:MFS transporter [Allonocardiopsis opalescens]PRX92320.1 UMF1 family MFS transporter [Allonocardiopsis opalescens]
MTASAPAPSAIPEPDPAQRRKEQRGWYVYDWANSVFFTSVITVFIGPYLNALAQTAAEQAGTGEHVHLLGLTLRYDAVYPAATAVAVVLQLITLPLVGAVTDHSRNKKGLLAGFATVGALATTALYFTTGAAYLPAAALLILANVAYGASSVVYNAFLNEIATGEERDRVSSVGWGVGYLGGAVLLALHLVLFLNAGNWGLTEGYATQIGFASAGVWWLGFSFLAIKPLRNRIGPLAAHGGGPQVRTTLRTLATTLRELRKYPRTLLYLIAFLLFNDGVQSVIRYAGPFATGDLGLGQQDLISAILMVQFVAFGGALALGWLARIFGAKRTILASLAVWCVLVGVGLVIPAGDPVAFFAMAFFIAIVLGGSQALSRSLFSQLIPKGKEGEYFGLYALCDRGAVFIASFVVTLAVQFSGGYRMAIFSLIAFFVIGGVLLALTDVTRGIREAGNEVPAKV